VDLPNQSILERYHLLPFELSPLPSVFSILQQREAIIRQASNLAWFFFCLFCEYTHQIPICIIIKHTKSQNTWRSATNADTKFCAPMPCQSLASRKRPPRSSWTRSIWRVISTAWVTPRYRTPAVVHVVAVVSRRVNAIADLLQTIREASKTSAGYIDYPIFRGCFARLSCCYGVDDLIANIKKEEIKYFNFQKIFDTFQKCLDDKSINSKIEDSKDFRGVPEYSAVYFLRTRLFVYLYIYGFRAVTRICWLLNVEECQFNTAWLWRLTASFEQINDELSSVTLTKDTFAKSIFSVV